MADPHRQKGRMVGRQMRKSSEAQMGHCQTHLALCWFLCIGILAQISQRFLDQVPSLGSFMVSYKQAQ